MCHIREKQISSVSSQKIWHEQLPQSQKLGRSDTAALSRTPGELKEAIVKQLCEVSGQRLILLRSNRAKKAGDAVL